MINRTQEEIMQDWGVDNSDTPLVSVRCITYNHEPYIAQALDGFLMQKTNFPFEVIVHDDAGPDKTADIIREYEAKFPKIIKPIYETENQYSKHDGSLGRIVDAACKGKYIALCEGDDYWIDENKLQMQVEFLENNPDYGMCYTQAKVYNQKKNEYEKNVIIGSNCESYETIFMNGYDIPSLTRCCNRNLYMQYIEDIQPSTKHWKMGDLPLALWFAKNSKIKYIPKLTSVYRILEESASHSYDKQKQQTFWESTKAIRKFFAEKYDELELFEEFIAFSEYKNAVENKDLEGAKKYAKKISLKYLKTIERIRNFIRCNKKIMNIYHIFRKVK